jgi:hypothetical protein
MFKVGDKVKCIGARSNYFKGILEIVEIINPRIYQCTSGGDVIYLDPDEMELVVPELKVEFRPYVPDRGTFGSGGGGGNIKLPDNMSVDLEHLNDALKYCIGSPTEKEFQETTLTCSCGEDATGNQGQHSNWCKKSTLQ